MFKEIKRLRAVVTAFTLILVVLYAGQQYKSYREVTGQAPRLLALSTVGERVMHLSAEMTRSAHMYVLTRQPRWLGRYLDLEPRFEAAVADLRGQVPGELDGEKELREAAPQLLQVERHLLELVRQGRTDEAQALLLNEAYTYPQLLYESGLAKLSAQLEASVHDLLQSRHRQALENRLIAGVIVLLLLGGWYLFLRWSDKWHAKINDLNRMRAGEAIASERELQQVNRQLRLLTAHLQEVREKERHATAYEISEELGQQLAALKMQVGTLAHKQWSYSSLAAELQGVSSQLSAAIDFLRGLAADVYPSVLRDLGLVEALEWQSERLAEGAGVQIVFSSGVEAVALDHGRALVLFRAYQEKLDALVHRGATEIVASLSCEGSNVVLRLWDDGRHPGSKKSVEELAIEERVGSIGGSIAAVSDREGGHLFTITIPAQGKGDRIVVNSH